MSIINSRPLKIALVSLQFQETSTGGGGVHVNSIVDQFLRHDQPVTILSMHTNRTGRHAPDQLYNRVSYSIIQEENLTVIRFVLDENIDHPYVGDKSTELDRIQRFAKICVSWLRDHQDEFDIINLHGHHIIPGWMAKELQNVKPKVISYLHALETTYVTESGEFVGAFGGGSILKDLRRWEAKCRYANIIIGNSTQVNDEIIAIIGEFDNDPQSYRSKLRLIASGCPASFLMDDEAINSKTKSLPEVIKLVTFCRIDPSKGVEYSIAGVQEAALRSHRNFHLTIAGIPASREYSDLLQSIAAECTENLKVEFRFLSAISPIEEKKSILDDKNIYILPTLKEPFGMSLIEASARGNMIVSADTNGPKYMFDSATGTPTDWGIITKRGLLVAITDDHKANLPSNIGSAIIHIAHYWDESRNRILNFNQKIRAVWTWEGIGEQYLKLFYNCLS